MDKKRIIFSIRFLLVNFAYWLVFFLLMRLVFFAINYEKTADTTLSELVNSMLVGEIFDLSITAYVSGFYAVFIMIFSWFTALENVIKVELAVSQILSSVLIICLPANAMVFTDWNAHFDATSLGMVSLDAIFSSVTNLEIFVFFLGAVILIFGNHLIFSWISRRIFAWKVDISAKKGGLSVAMIIFFGLMVIPARGGVGIAPLNTGRAYFCENLFANQASINPVWNFMYSSRKAKKINKSYNFMTDEEALERFNFLMERDTITEKIFTVERPNIVVILLESFSEHGIRYIGGENATPCLDSLLHESIAFDNIMAVSDRSGKGLVAVTCGYPVLPNISIIQYPQKSQTLSFLPREMKNLGYEDQLFLYGGDLNFNCFNSLIKLAGYEKVIDQDDFSADQMGEKWGAHDEYTFTRLLEEMDKQQEPFFDFYFTLSSHRPFTVPMERKLEDDYLNSMAYTDKCIGNFFQEAKTKSWWENTIFILIADHGHSGPKKATYADKSRFHIPLIFTGGPLAYRDTIIHKYGSQIDLVQTILGQLDYEGNTENFRFSKDLFSCKNGFAFFDYNDGYGFINDSVHNVYDNAAGRYIRNDFIGENDTISGRAILQILSEDYRKR